MFAELKQFKRDCFLGAHWQHNGILYDYYACAITLTHCVLGAVTQAGRFSVIVCFCCVYLNLENICIIMGFVVSRCC